MSPIDKASLAVPLQGLGLSAETIAHIETALGQGDGRALLHELLLHGLRDNVGDESWSQPQWLDEWRTLGANGFPLINADAPERLLQAGADPHDLPAEVQAQIPALIQARKMSQAAALWKKESGSDLRHRLHTVQSLAGQWSVFDGDD